MLGISALADSPVLIALLGIAAFVVSITAISSAGVCDSSGHNNASGSSGARVVGPFILYRATSNLDCNTTCQYHNHGCLMLCSGGECGGTSSKQCSAVAVAGNNDVCLCTAAEWQYKDLN